MRRPEAIAAKLGAFALATAACAPLGAAAAACRDVSAPAVIRESGCVRVIRDIVAKDPADSALVVYADGVTIDLNGHTLRGPGAASTAPGVHALGGDNLTVRNGTINGFLYGVRAESYFKDAINSVVVEGITVGSGTARGIYARAGRVLIHNNVVRNLAGYALWAGSHTIGIEVVADSCWIADNTVSEIYPEGSGEGVAISFSDPSRQCHVSGNRITNLNMPRSGRSIAIWVSSDQPREAGDRLTIEDNFVSGYQFAFMASLTASRFVRRNVFEVNCTPADLGRHGGGGDNAFRHVGDPCADSPTRLEVLAGKGDVDASIRRAAAYIEQQWLYAEEHSASELCERYVSAKNLLDPSVRQGNAAAMQQMVRLTPLLVACDRSAR